MELTYPCTKKTAISIHSQIAKDYPLASNIVKVADGYIVEVTDHYYKTCLRHVQIVRSAKCRQ